MQKKTFLDRRAHAIIGFISGIFISACVIITFRYIIDMQNIFLYAKLIFGGIITALTILGFFAGDTLIDFLNGFWGKFWN